MMYAVLCYNNEETVCGWTKEQDDAVMAALTKVHDKWEGAGKLKPSIRLLPTSAATTLHKSKDMVIDGPYAETKGGVARLLHHRCERTGRGAAVCA